MQANLHINNKRMFGLPWRNEIWKWIHLPLPFSKNSSNTDRTDKEHLSVYWCNYYDQIVLSLSTDKYTFEPELPSSNKINAQRDQFSSS